MAKLIYACSRRGAFGAQTEAKLRRICATLTPDNIRGRTEPTVRVGANSAFAVTNASAGLMEDGWSVMLGRLYEEGDAAWAAPRSPFPDGSYAIVRASDDAVEVVSDPAGSRTIWRYMDDDVFVAATSQRAIVAFVGGLEFNRATIPWFLSTGTLGPELSWDRRLTRLQPESSVILDRRAWRLDDGPRTKIAFSAVERSPREHEAALRDALLGTARSLRGLDWTKWALPLSGGYDSRGILCLLKDHVGIPDDFRAITWGLKSSLTERGNDAMVARQLAERMGVRHEYLHTDLSSEPIEAILDRFVFCAEGRTDHFAGYADGLDIWRRLHDEHIHGIIRGDEGFGWVTVTSELGTKLSVEGALCSDFENLKHVPELLGLPAHELPDFLQRAPDESLEAWRDKLYHAYRIPTVLAALSDVKLPYVEQITPLVSRALIKVVRQLPDNLRTEKSLYRRIIVSIALRVPFATRGANADTRDIEESPEFAALMRAELSDSLARDLLGSQLASEIVGGIAEDRAGIARPSRLRRVKGAVAQRLPRFVKDRLRATVMRPTVAGNALAFRAFMIARMHRLLKSDSEVAAP